MSTQELAALNKAIKDQQAAGLAKCREVSPAAVQRFKEKIQNYPLTGKAAWLAPHRERISDWVVRFYRDGNDTADLDDIRRASGIGLRSPTGIWTYRNGGRNRGPSCSG